MRYLKPKGMPLEINNKTYSVLFTLDMIDELQDRTKMSINELLSLTTNKKYRIDAIKCILKYITGQLVELNENELDYYSAVLLSTYIEQLKPKETSKGKKTVESEEYPFVDVERWFYIGTTILGYPKDEVWNMTLGQLGTLEYKHAVYNGYIKEDKVENVDDVIPL